MGTKTLKEKIFDIAFWTVYFFCAFLIVGYLINSGFLKVVPAKDKIYEILKDALSISAAFLAPVAAFVLFSDWREEHVAKNLEIITDDLNRLFRDLDLLYYFYNSDLKSNIEVNILSFQHFRVNSTLPLIREEILLNESKILANSDDIEKYKNYVKQIVFKTNEINGLYTRYKDSNKIDRNGINEEILKSYDDLLNQIQEANLLGNLIKQINFE